MIPDSASIRLRCGRCKKTINGMPHFLPEAKTEIEKLASGKPMKVIHNAECIRQNLNPMDTFCEDCLNIILKGQGR